MFMFVEVWFSLVQFSPVMLLCGLWMSVCICCVCSSPRFLPESDQIYNIGSSFSTFPFVLAASTKNGNENEGPCERESQRVKEKVESEHEFNSEFELIARPSLALNYITLYSMGSACIALCCSGILNLEDFTRDSALLCLLTEFIILPHCPILHSSFCSSSTF